MDNTFTPEHDKVRNIDKISVFLKEEYVDDELYDRNVAILIQENPLNIDNIYLGSDCYNSDELLACLVNSSNRKNKSIIIDTETIHPYVSCKENKLYNRIGSIEELLRKYNTYSCISRDDSLKTMGVNYCDIGNKLRIFTNDQKYNDNSVYVYITYMRRLLHCIDSLMNTYKYTMSDINNINNIEMEKIHWIMKSPIIGKLKTISNAIIMDTNNKIGDAIKRYMKDLIDSIPVDTNVTRELKETINAEYDSMTYMLDMNYKSFMIIWVIIKSFIKCYDSVNDILLEAYNETGEHWAYTEKQYTDLSDCIHELGTIRYRINDIYIMFNALYNISTSIHLIKNLSGKYSEYMNNIILYGDYIDTYRDILEKFGYRISFESGGENGYADISGLRIQWS